ncbi:MAG: chemotaxis protein CheW [Nitrospinota bacterium]
MTDNTIWETIRKRAEELKARSLKKKKPSREEKEQILKARAKKLSRKWTSKPDDKEIFTCITFQIRGEKYAISAYNITEIFEAEKISFIPCIPSCFAGMTNHRGKALTVIDLAELFNLPTKGETSSEKRLREPLRKGVPSKHGDKVIVLEDGRLSAGIIADKIDGLVELPLTQIKKVSSVLPEKNSCIKSEVLVAEKQTHIIDVPQLLRNKNLIVDSNY